MSRTDGRQRDLFAPKPRNFDEAALMRRLDAAVKGAPIATGSGLSRAAIKRLMTPLPAITAWR